jgi:hypothetical protein
MMTSRENALKCKYLLSL